ncbi:S-adenosyl-L-methionine-dependent methyltransferase [Aspergillus ambiguus]|uniref:gliotoxin thiomethyltransferase n=1 Tax=Aspergillus ambiguus TaxID=176160 RepID=UPI003CCE17E5
MAKQELMNLFLSKDFVTRYKLAERVTGPFAQILVNYSGVAQNTRPPVILDHACGTGVVSDALVHSLDLQTIKSWDLTCGDISPGLVEYMSRKIQDEGWPNAKAKLVDAQDTKLPTGHFTHIFAAFALVGFPNPAAALRECLRILQPGGTLAISNWQLPEWIVIAKAAVETMPGNLPFPTVKEFLSKLNEGWDSEEPTRAHLQREGFDAIEVETVTQKISLPQSTLVELIIPILPFILSHFWTQEQRKEYEKDIPTALQRYLAERYGADGDVLVEPRVIIATARKPC